MSAKSIDKILSDSYKQLKDAEYGKRYEIFAPAFKKSLMKYLSSPVTFNSNLDTLETLITIRQSEDKKIKFYSWDELTGGTWHEINSFAQFKGSGNKILFKQLDTDKEIEDGGYTDSEIYEVHQIDDGLKVYYLTFGWGTHGNGGHYQIIQVFRIELDILIKCKAFGDGQTELVVEYPRMERLNLEFDRVTRVVSFDEFAENELEQFAQKTGKRKALKFSNGSFE